MRQELIHIPSMCKQAMEHIKMTSHGSHRKGRRMVWAGAKVDKVLDDSQLVVDRYLVQLCI